MTNTPTTRAGFVAIVGQTNAGKSTLMNAMMGQKLAIVTPKVQTTRMNLRGVLTENDAQLIFVDTPGLHIPKRLLDEKMVESAHQAWKDADVVLMVLDARKGFTEMDETLCASIKASGKPAFLIVNKIDLISDKEELLPLLQKITELNVFADVFPISALNGTRGKEKVLPQVVAALQKKIPEGPYLYDEETVTDMPTRYLAAEITREKAFLFLQDELPYGLAVETVQLEEFENGDVRIDQTILIERDAHKPMVIGKNGEMLKKIGTSARKELSQALGRKAHVFLTVKVKKDWAKNPRHLGDLGLLTSA